ncbi:MAG: response regulator [Chitinivibrionales bacterium]|nr:response regulator [Chitinivibrionales bacterium]
MAKILIVDDEGKMRALLAMALDAEGYDIDEADSAEAALDYLLRAIPDVIITDVRMPGMDGVELVKQIRSRHPGIECIVMTAYADAKSGIDAMRNGAMEYVAKPFEMDEMLLLVKSALGNHSLKLELNGLKNDVQERYSLDRLITRSPAMLEVISQAKIVAGRDTTVLIRGKSGTGKELIARGIHVESGRKGFTAINCAALTETLLESELFGHEKGSFTGAHDRKTGLFERAGSGTVFLDEIGDISLNLQVKLLRVLQEREFTRVGGAETLHTDARVIAATNKNLEQAQQDGAFRNDLYYRLNVFPIRIPPLAQRSDDVPPLVEYFMLKLHHVAGISAIATDKLRAYAWPGNVRELENTIERAVIMSAGTCIEAVHLPEHIATGQTQQSANNYLLPAEGIALDEVEKNFILQALSLAQGNKTNAAKLLGISRRALYSKMNTHGIET